MTKEERIASIIDYLENMESFKDETSIPNIPLILSKEDYNKYLVPNYIKSM